jgi:phosphatidylinositol 3,5-bisphosphate 5-phosphatase
MIESIKRYYSNSFTDAEKQDAINLFLGVYKPEHGKPPLWDLPTDFYLHNDSFSANYPKSYIYWWSPEHLVGREKFKLRQSPSYLFDLYYKPKMYTSIDQQFSYNLISTVTKEDIQEVSPFIVRVNPQQTTRYLMMYSLNIGGVKRWLALSNNPEAPEKKLERVKSTRKSIKAPVRVNATAALVEKLLNPQVEASEEREYKR